MELTHYLNILEQDGLAARIQESARRRAARFFTPAHGLINKKFFADVAEDALPDNFLVAHKERVLATKPPAKQPETDPSFDGAYHLVDDRRLERILREGSFKRLDEHGNGAVSTGRLERKMGLAGLFCTYKYSYDGYSHDDITNVVVFGRQVIYAPDTLCLKTECSFNMIFGMDEEVQSDGSFHDEFLEGRELDDLSGKEVRNFTADDKARFTLHCVAYALSSIEHPDEMAYWEHRMGCKTASELVVNDPKLLAPQMILVEDEPEFFYETQQAAGNGFSGVPIVEDAHVRRAMRKHCQTPPQPLPTNRERDWYREQFVEGVNRKIISLEEYRFQE